MRRFFALAILLLPLPALAQEVPQIHVTGQGEVSVAPDLARVQVGVTTQAEAAADALAANSEATAAVLARLAEQGVAEADLQTGNLSLYPRRGDARPVDGTDAQITLGQSYLDFVAGNPNLPETTVPPSE